MSQEYFGPDFLARGPSATQRPSSATEQLPPSKWSELSRGESVWVHEDGWGFDAGRVDDVSTHRELLWVEFAGRGRRLLCGGDPVQVWTRG